MKASPKTLLLLAGALLAIAPVMNAAESSVRVAQRDGSDNRGPGPRGGMMMERAKAELNLSAEQEAKWKEIGEKERAAFEALRGDNSTSREDRRAKLMELSRGFAEQRRAVLNADQQKKFDQMRARMAERGGPGGGPGPRQKDN